ncbi:9381_t:CDS:2, partial [Acaulospora morrowiae]
MVSRIHLYLPSLPLPSHAHSKNLSSWLASIYARTHPTDDEDFFEISTRYGSFALLMFSFASVAAGTILPQLTPTTYPSKNIFTVYNIYTASHLLFALFMMCTFFVETVGQSIVLIASIGIPWAVAMWVPFALVGEFVQRKELYDSIKANGNDVEREIGTSVSYASISSATSSPSLAEDSDEQEEFDSGMILGVHNMYIVFPQFIISVISAAIIKLVEELTNTGGGIDNIGKNDAYGWVFRFGGLMSLVAAFLSRYLIDLHVYR